MWVAKFLMYDEKGLYGTKAKKFNVTLYAYARHYYTKRNRAYLLTALLMDGEDENKKEFIQNLEKEKNIVKIETYKDFLICLNYLGKKESKKKYGHIFFNPSILYVKPIIISSSGWEEWEVASFEKKDISDMIEAARKLYNLELKHFRKEKVKDVHIFKMAPKLTPKQKKAFVLAIEQGYYEYPKKINIEKLARLMKCSFSTYRAHLRKAEKRILAKSK